MNLNFLNHIPPKDSGRPSFWYQALGHLNLMIWVLFAVVVLAYFVMFRTSIGLRLRSVGEHPRAADTVGIDVYKTRYGAVIVSGVIASLGGAYLAIGYVHSFTENMTAGRGFIGLAALIAGNWRPATLSPSRSCSASSAASRRASRGTATSTTSSCRAIPYVITLIAVIGVIGRSFRPQLLDGRTSSSRANPRAGWSLACGILSLVAMPVGVVLARESQRVTLRLSTISIAVALLLGWFAIILARRARERIDLTLGRAGGASTARIGRLLGIIGILLATTAALAVGFWGLLTLFAG